MLGLAQQLFVEREKGNPWKEQQRFFSAFKWPLLESLAGEAELALTEILLKEYPEVDEDVAAFICHLSICARAGHICVKMEDEEILPDPSESWTNASENDAESFLKALPKLRAAILAGARKLPKELVREANNWEYTVPICRLGNLYYLQRYWLLEKRCLTEFTKLLGNGPALKIDDSRVHPKLDHLKNHLLPEQLEAIWKGCALNFTIISGGPGTGKTFTAGHLIQVFWDCLTEEQRKNCRIALAAPTGKAASNLEHSIRHALKDVSDFPQLTAQTLHSLLGIRSSRGAASSLAFSYDLLIVDECSMINVGLMGQLLRALKPGARIILLGDRHQLPPVEAGSLFSELVAHFLSTDSLKKYVAELKTCMRTDLQEIVQLAAMINQGDSEGVRQSLAQSNQHILRYVSCDFNEPKRWQRQLIDYALPLLPDQPGLDQLPSLAFQKFNGFRLLAPYRKGLLGVDTLNRLFLEASLEKTNESWFAMPIMIVKNDYRLELFNGEVGILIRRRVQVKWGADLCSEGDKAIFPAKDHRQPVRTFSALMLPKFEYAYCQSIYKSQGSEFDHVLLVLPESLNSFSRELLYTGVTRARKRLEIWSNDLTLQQSIKRYTQGLSGIVEYLMANPLPAPAHL